MENFPNPAQSALNYFKYLKTIGIDYVEPERYLEKPGANEPELNEPIVADKKEEMTKKEKMLAELNKNVEGCTACRLHKTRTQTVFGTGTHKAGIMFVGEAPGAEEDKQGKPFVGRAGKLLTKMIEAIDFTRDEVFIANVLKCRPPENRPPKPDEIALCEHFLIDQIKTIKPKVICALGTHAAQTLLRTGDPIGRLRGIFTEYNGVPLLPTYHPSFLLRSPQYKKLAWQDLQMVRDKHKELTK